MNMIGTKIEFIDNDSEKHQGIIIDKISVSVPPRGNFYLARTDKYLVDAGKFVTDIHPYQINKIIQ